MSATITVVNWDTPVPADQQEAGDNFWRRMGRAWDGAIGPEDPRVMVACGGAISQEIPLMLLAAEHVYRQGRVFRVAPSEVCEGSTGVPLRESLRAAVANRHLLVVDMGQGHQAVNDARVQALLDAAPKATLVIVTAKPLRLDPASPLWETMHVAVFSGRVARDPIATSKRFAVETVDWLNTWAARAATDGIAAWTPMERSNLQSNRDWNRDRLAGRAVGDVFSVL